ncbi:adaptor complexes medium subunit domain containing protein [Neospora caninum Liverpool]|uniref:Adaptor complexes medium subunit domain containing protein n=1 Tax=Neospora caninum (strain Liverpool) TaxID=572307 RepID=F0VJK1_NEOCL|nr:adaptor complexes medium subunit domain containing protein [Neospora caninum Liverpool]CBZ53912.1 adaptor complexes medium subunit domain containing protein [Neospora caninum Liverpool]CEL67910.1 TPA: adaptor complexes medium subunit domain containing protein, putative [Neospora caninum Liverpool]|eukprot:XP_003883944.1 adaptor complexes medium subunit domain containing protein [Neospora caninum Liverpool]
MRGARGTVLLHVHHNNLLFVGVTTKEVEPLLLLDLLQQMQTTLAWYCGTASSALPASLRGGSVSAEAPLTEETLRKHFSLIYVLLDEMSSSGYPATVQSNVLQMLVPRPSVIETAMKLVNGSSRVLSSLAASFGLAGSPGQAGAAEGRGGQCVRPALESEAGAGMGCGSGSGEGGGISGAGSDRWWRRGNVHYASNEVYVDVVEAVHAVVDADGKMVQASLSGSIQMNNRLSGLPELCLTLRNSALLKDASFHPCVKLPRFKRDGVLSFCPPDGEFVLASYWLCDSKFTLPLSLSGTAAFPSPSLPPPKFGHPTPHTVSGLRRGSGPPGAASLAGRFELRLAPFCPVGASACPGSASGVANLLSSRTMECVAVSIPLPAFVDSATATATCGAIRYLHNSSCLLWEVGSLAFDAPTQKAEGTLTLVAEEAKRVDVLSPCETTLVASVQFLIKNWVPSGFKLDSLDVSNINVPPYKGCRYSTVAGTVEFRIDSRTR